MKVDYLPSSSSFSEGFMGPKGNVGYNMVYDHEMAVSIVKKFIADGRNITCAISGLDGDWDINNDTIYEDGEFFEPDFYSHSTWAEPSLLIYFSDAPSEFYPVWRRVD